MSAVNKLRQNAPAHLNAHMDLVSKHAKAMVLAQEDSEEDSEDTKAKSYTHDFETASKAIKAALTMLRKELQSGHNHDVDVLKRQKSSAGNTLSSGVEGAKNKVKSLKHAGCPTKRAEEKADEDKAKAKRHRDDVKNKKICPLGTTWDDMDIHKTVPKYGAELRSAWDKARAEWVSKYNALNRDVQSNVGTRKQVDISSKVVECYVKHMTNNAAAKTCADRARRADVSIWNIDGGKLNDCESKAHLENAFGPKSWTATKKNCAPAKVAPKKKVVKEAKEDEDDESLLEELEF